MFPLDEQTRRSLSEARVESLRRSMAAASRAEDARRPGLRARIGFRLIALGERLARPSEAFAP
jgi:hypothetical protein